MPSSDIKRRQSKWPWKHREGMGIVAEELPKGPIIARIEEQGGELGPAGGFLLTAGLVAMIAAFFLETSAIRLAAWGAVWTGWNVLWGFLIMIKRERNYVVYREPEQHDRKTETQA
jgi:hypothetical protein